MRIRQPLGGLYRALVLLVVLLLSACETVVERDGPGKLSKGTGAADAVPRKEPKSKYGNPESYVVFGKRYHTMDTADGFSERGVASWYGKKFHGRKTSSGQVYDMYQMTAAHKHLPLPTYVEVTNLDNGRRAVVKVNDRGPFHDNRIIDLSYAAALKLGIAEKGTGFVEIRALNPDDPGARGGARTPVSTVDSRAPEGVFLQVGAFEQHDNAARLAGRIRRVVPVGVHIRAVQAGGRTMHRVQLGPIASVDTADAVVAVLDGLGLRQHHFVSSQ